jgi:hypothetical protein
LIVFTFPYANLFASIIAILDRHFKITLTLLVLMEINRETYQNQNEMPIRIGMELVKTLLTILGEFIIDMDSLEISDENLRLLVQSELR